MKSRQFTGKETSRERPVAVEKPTSGDTAGAAPLAAGVPLGKIIPRKLVEDPAFVMLSDPRTALAERYRRLAAQLDRISNEAEVPCQIVTVTSAMPDEGKTTTTVNLGLALAERRDSSVLIIDADLRRHGLSGCLQPMTKLGLGEVLEEEAPLDHALFTLENAPLTVLPSGESIDRPLEVLGSDFLAELLARLKARFDYILIDTPPTVPFSDAAVVGARSDGVLLVVRAGQSRKPLIDRALQSLEGTSLLGAILNDVELTVVDRVYYRYDDYSDPYAYREKRHRKRR